MVEKIFRRLEVKRAYGDPPWSTFYHRQQTGDIPKPDVMLGDDTPGWTEGHINRHQKQLKDRGSRDRQSEV
jgi:hypothetical protein